MNYWEHPDWPHWLARIRAMPECDHTRLIAADWLSDHGFEERAELVRVALESYRLDRQPTYQPGLFPLLVRRDELANQNARRWWGDAATLGYLRSPPDKPNTFDGGHVQRGFWDRISAPLATLIGGRCPECAGTGHCPTPTAV